MSSTKTQRSLASVANEVLHEFDLDFLKDEYEHQTGLSVSFEDCKRHYVEYLLAMIAANSLLAIDNSLQLSPPLHVDVLWHSHILETRRYREFEQRILEAYRQSERDTDLQHLDHSVVDNKNGREERIRKTKGFYQLLGFTFVNTDEEEEEKDTREEDGDEQDEASSVAFMKVISAKESDISIHNVNEAQLDSDSEESIQILEKRQFRKRTLCVDDSSDDEESTASEDHAKLVEVSPELDNIQNDLVHEHENEKELNACNPEIVMNSSCTTSSNGKEDNAIALPETLLAASLKKQTLEVTVPPGTLGVILSDDARGTFVKSKSSSRTALLVNDVILRVGNEKITTQFQCADALLKDKDRERTLLIERYASEDSISSSNKQQHAERHPAMLRSKRCHDNTKGDSTQKKKSKVAVAQEEMTSSSVSAEESSSSKYTNEKTDKSCGDTSKSNIYTFEIKTLTGATLRFKAKGSTLFSKVSRVYHTRSGIVPEVDPRFLLDGKVIDMEMTIGQLLGNKLDGKVILFVPRLRGC